MYIYIIRGYIMKRTQIYIDDEMFSFLEKESKLKNKSISELIRESIRGNYIYNSNVMVKRLHDVFGQWSNRLVDVNTYKALSNAGER